MRGLDTRKELVHLLDDDITVRLAGYRGAQTLVVDEIRKARPELEMHVIGDCLSPRLLRNAVVDGVRFGSLL
jgi:hypothetical protein